jgi:hypothetical protein
MERILIRGRARVLLRGTTSFVGESFVTLIICSHYPKKVFRVTLQYLTFLIMNIIKIRLRNKIEDVLTDFLILYIKREI